MPRNVEIKARVASTAALQAMEARAVAMAGKPAFALRQDDSFFHAPQGRLKLRVESRDGGPAEAVLIAYQRPDQSGPKLSRYRITPTADPDGLRETLALACGAIGRVVKDRRVVLVGRTRVHLDRVEGLGPFVELEVVLREGEALEAGEAEARALMAGLGIAEADRLEPAYLDLLAARSDPSR